MSPLRLLQGAKQFQKRYVCPWCGASFESRTGDNSLGEHWETDPRCKANARSNNPTTTKYGMANGIEDVPGEQTLMRIRAKECDHPEMLREALRTDFTEGAAVIGYRCGYCYTEVYNT